MENKKDNDLTEIISHALDEMKHDFGEKFNPDHINLAELQRRTGISRSKLRRISKTGFIDKPHALTGRKAETTILSGFQESSMPFWPKVLQTHRFVWNACRKTAILEVLQL
ncbi:MAG: hypothetical protein ACLU48_05995 [Clostridiaceae bacterium]